MLWDSEEMSVHQSAPLSESFHPVEGPDQDEERPCWYALHTRSQHEKQVAARLEGHGFTTFLPLRAEIHRWSDRRQVVQMPVFSCYVFVQMCLVPETWATITRTSGVLRIVGGRGEGVPIPASQIESIQRLVESNLSYQLCPFLQIGQRVRIRGGALDGVNGLLIARSGDRTLVISVEPIQRSISVRIDQYQVEPIS
jgi:transcription antitermination factor NusG